METLDFCKKHNACREGVEFASKFQTLAEVWDACPRADWMIWMLQKADKTGGLDRTLRIFACDCAASATNPTDHRSLSAIAVARRYAEGLATSDELRAAYADSASDASDAYASDSAYAAAYAAAAATAADASYAAIYTSAYAASAYADAAYADADAEAAAEAAYARASAATRKTHADRLRAAIPNPFTKVGHESP